MSDTKLERIRDVVHRDIGNRGLATDSERNLLNACPGDLAAACRSLAETESPAVGILTGFYIPHGEPPGAETDGPLGAVFLARALVPLGFRVVLLIDNFGRKAVETGLWASGIGKTVPVVTLPAPADDMAPWDYREFLADRTGTLTHLIALERVGPSHTPDSLKQLGDSDEVIETFRREVPVEHFDRYHTMKGLDVTRHMSPAHFLFDESADASAGSWSRPITIGIGDGGNEIGMGKIRWEVIRRNIPGGAAIACRIPTDHLIVAGVSNWGAYALAAGVRLLRDAPRDPDLFNPEREHELLHLMVEKGLLVDGVSGQATATVDGLEFETYAAVLTQIRALLDDL